VDPCTLVDEPAAPGDVHFTQLDSRSVLDLAVGDAGGEVELTAWDVVFTPSALASPTTLKRLRLQSQDFGISFTAGSPVTLQGVVMSFEAPVTLAFSGSVYVVPAGTIVDTCGSIDGRPWHGSAPLAQEFLVSLDVPDGILSLDGNVPLVVRADDAQCSRSVLNASVLAAGSADGGVGDAATAD
jgi:hypothetical protein